MKPKAPGQRDFSGHYIFAAAISPGLSATHAAVDARISLRKRSPSSVKKAGPSWTMVHLAQPRSGKLDGFRRERAGDEQFLLDARAGCGRVRTRSCSMAEARRRSNVHRGLRLCAPRVTEGARRVLRVGPEITLATELGYHRDGTATGRPFRRQFAETRFFLLFVELAGNDATPLGLCSLRSAKPK